MINERAEEVRRVRIPPRRVKRSEKKVRLKKSEVKKTGYGKLPLLLGILCLTVSFAGCGKKDDDPAGREVLQISITPEPTPTPEPEQLNPDAVVTEGSLTMVNGYLVEGIGTTRAGKGKLGTGDSDSGIDGTSGTGAEPDGGEDSGTGAEPDTGEDSSNENEWTE